MHVYSKFNAMFGTIADQQNNYDYYYYCYELAKQHPSAGKWRCITKTVEHMSRHSDWKRLMHCNVSTHFTTRHDTHKRHINR